jgi:hypothetical protein
MVADDKDTMERAKELFVYGPIGLAMYVRDTAPSFLKVFVARGRAEVEQRRRSVGDQLNQVRDLGETATGGGAPTVLRIVTDGFARVRETAEGALGSLGTRGPDDAPRAGAGTATPSAGEGAGAPSPARPDRTGRADAHLAIPDYDDLSASQVVDRLDGLGTTELAEIRDHEVTHRARATILGKIEQLTRAS